MTHTLTILLINLVCMSAVFAQIDLEEFLRAHRLLHKSELLGAETRGRSFQRRNVTQYGEFDVRYYGLSVSFDEQNSWIEGSVDIAATSNSDSLAEIELDLTDNLNVRSVTGNVSSFGHTSDRIAIILDTTHTTGQSFELTIHYDGYPQTSGFQALGFSSHNGNPVISSLSEPYSARDWWPCKDVPSDKADSADIWITCRSDFIGVSNGILMETTDNGDGTITYHWHESYPITTYLISVAITNYTTFSDIYTALDGSTTMNVDYFVYPEHLTAAQESFSETVPMIEYFASVFGEYPFLAEKYGMAEFQWGGAMEHQTCTSMGSGSIQHASTIAHELAHQWWGDMVTCASFQHIWLNEGFASYAEPLYFSHVYGEYYYDLYMSFFDQAQDWDGDPVFREDTTDVQYIFDWTVYAKGAWVLHMLRHVLGDQDFFNSLLAYRDQYEMSVALTEDFRDVCESVSSMDLNWFFQQWIYETGRPSYSGYWSKVFDGDRWTLMMELEQVQPSGVIFKMPLDLSIQMPSGDTTVIAWDSLQFQSFEILLPEEPTDVLLDPDNWVLKEVLNFAEMTIPSDLQLPNAFSVGNNYPNPFNAVTYIPITVPSAGHLLLKVFDLRGIVVLTKKISLPSTGSFDLPIDLGDFPSSVYVAQTRFGENCATQKIVLLK